MLNPLRNFDRLPIRVRLTVWYTVSFMIVMAFSFASFFLVTKNLMLGKIDDSLTSQAMEITNLLKSEALSPLSKEIILNTFRITKTNFVLVLDNNNQIIAQSITFPIEPEFLTHLQNDINFNRKPHFFTIENIRFYMEPLMLTENPTGIIIVGDSVTTISDAFGVLLNTLIVVFFLFLLPLILISFLEADISLSPLRELTKKMNAISTHNLSDRVNVANPKDEIGEVGMAFNNLLDRLQKGFVKERQLIHDISHQLKTPLTAMRSDIEIALSKRRSLTDYHSILKDLGKDTSRMDSLLKDMMSFAWAASEEQEKSFKELNLSQILEEAAEITTQIAFEKKIEVNTTIEPNIKVTGQKEKLFQVCINILENAVKYTPSKGRVIVQASTDNTQTKVIIKDSGIGIASNHLPHIFERFYRVNTSEHEGSGLGLSIASALVKAHRGKIEVTSHKGEGTTFVITLPLIHPKFETIKVKKIANPENRLKILPISIKRKSK